MKNETIIKTYYGHKSIKILIYVVISILSFFAFSWFKTVDAAELNVNAYINGSLTYKTTNNIGYWRKDITISPNGDEYYINFNFELSGIKNGASYVVDTTICTTGEYYGYTSQSNISNDFAYIETLSHSNGGSCTISGYTGKYVNVSYYVKFYDDLAYNGESTSTYAGLANFKAWSGYTPIYNNIVHVFDIKMQEVGENYLEKYKTNSKLDQQINQNQTIIDQNNQTNSKLDEIETMQPDTTETPDDSSYKDYEQSEEELEEYIKQADTSVLDVAIDTNTSKFIWDTMTSFIKSNALVFSTIIALLSIGIIKLALNR